MTVRTIDTHSCFPELQSAFHGSAPYEGGNVLDKFEMTEMIVM